jgi:hypothetical protein
MVSADVGVVWLSDPLGGGGCFLREAATSPIANGRHSLPAPPWRKAFCTSAVPLFNTRTARRRLANLSVLCVLSWLKPRGHLHTDSL